MRHYRVEQVGRQWIVRLQVLVVLLSLVLPTCAHHGAAGSAGPGLGVSQEALQAIFARQAFDFTFEPSHDSRGVPMLSGTVSGKLIALHLIGSPENLIEVTLIVGVPSTDPLAPPADPKVLAENARYLRAVLEQTVPDWKDAVKWLNIQLQGSPERLEVGLRPRAPRNCAVGR